MYSQTNEKAFEQHIEFALAGCNADIGEVRESVKHQGFVLSSRYDFDAQYALDLRLFWDFLEHSQAEKLAELKRFNPNDWQRKFLTIFDRCMKSRGILDILKKGLDVDHLHFDLFYAPPVPHCAEQVRLNFAKNVWSVMRQVPFSQQTNETADMALFVNGIPIVTLELKNQYTGQNATIHGREQYQRRDVSQTLFQPARCLVHFALDQDVVWMTTRLNGKETIFLPFNKGNNMGAGNPPNPKGFKTAYLWEEIFTKDSLANIIQHFVRLEDSSKSKKQDLSKRTLFFPRYHQLDVVRKLVADCAEQGVGQRYLIQHSAGSGKSNSITWAAFQLIETYPNSQNAAKNRLLAKPLFDSVIVVTDRRLLDKQLGNNISAFSEVKNILARVENSQELKRSLEQGKKIIITTIQKFPFIVDGIADLSDKNFAVIIDEAHSSQSGSAHDNMNRAMGLNGKSVVEIGDEFDAQEAILTAMQSRKMRGNASYFAFTATPKNSTLEKFGQQNADGKFVPFHLYSMKQAIEEGFILDVLANYTTYKSFYEIQKQIAENPEYDTKKAHRILTAYVERSQESIDVKAQVMLDHFIDNLFARKKLQGKAKAMVVTQSIENAIRYYFSLKNLLVKRGKPFNVLIAFSGEKTYNGQSVTEAVLNGFAENDLPLEFDKDENRILVVANKYLTGFDQPKLCAMYVDKKLSDVLCVQALSRLNRAAPKLGKRTEDLFVLDFFNTVDDIKKSFDPFYTSTTLLEATDINVLNDLMNALDSTGIYELAEMSQFTEGYFRAEKIENLTACYIDLAANRFNWQLELEQAEKADFKVKAKQFIKIYGQMAAIIPFDNIQWEKRYWFYKFLVPKLLVSDVVDPILQDFLDNVDLSTYALARVKIGESIKLDEEESELKPSNPNMRGTHEDDEQRDPLDDIVQQFNEQHFTDISHFSPDELVAVIEIMARASDKAQAHPDFQAKYVENEDSINKALVLQQIMKDVMTDLRADYLNVYKRFISDSAFQKAFTANVARRL